MVSPRIGVLALQGDFEAHVRALRGIGCAPAEVRRVEQLRGLDGLVLPGGESTTLLRLMDDEPWFDRLRAFHARGGALFGTCAGVILLAREVRHPAQASLGLLDAVVERNAWGRQVESFEARLDPSELGADLRGVFIRAPRLVELGDRVRVLGRFGGEPVLVRQGRILAATFHPELTGDPRIHRGFVEIVAADGGEAIAREAVSTAPWAAARTS
jgi:5'-phosphate synthase pdxT subunit